MKWISINEETPPICKVVILYSPEIKAFCGSLNTDGKWYYARYYKHVHVSNEITHWMPLPEYPLKTEPIQITLKNQEDESKQ